MKETLLIGDHILVNKFIYGIKIPFVQKTLIPIKEPRREDIIVFRYPENPKLDFIKRVIGVAGDTILIKNKKLFVNGKLVERPYAVFKDSYTIPSIYNKRDNYGPVTVPENALFVMGDNRDNSKDSRFWGFVNLSAVKGKAFMIYWSWNKNNSQSVIDYVRWSRIGNLLE
jgi:signal peptidase I